MKVIDILENNAIRIKTCIYSRSQMVWGKQALESNRTVLGGHAPAFTRCVNLGK